jgi:hypothetical protein
MDPQKRVREDKSDWAKVEEWWQWNSGTPPVIAIKHAQRWVLGT